MSAEKDSSIGNDGPVRAVVVFAGSAFRPTLLELASHLSMRSTTAQPIDGRGLPDRFPRRSSVRCLTQVFEALPRCRVTMGVRCSLFGCDYGDSEIEREREERGSEVVMTVREYETCSRCGNTRVISENTGVTSLAAEIERPDGDRERAPSRADDDPATAPEAGSPTTADASPDTAPDDSDGPGLEDGAEIVDEEPTDDPSLDPSPGDSPAEAEADDLETVDPDESAQILGAGDDGPDGTDVSSRQNETGSSLDPGEVIAEAEPDDADDDRLTATGDWPEHGTDDRSTNDSDGGSGEATDETPDDDAVIMDETAEESLAPSAGDDPGTATDHAPWPGADGEPTTTEARAQTTARTGRAAPDDPEDDAVIMDDSGPARERSAWPESETTATADVGDTGGWPDVGPTAGTDAPDPGGHGEWPDLEGEDRGWDATTDDGGTDVEVTGLTPGASETASRGSAPGVPGDESPAGSPTADDGATGGSPAPATDGQEGAADRNRSSTTGDRSDRTTRDRDALTCPNCRHVVAVGESPHAAGDVCPDCTGGYLTDQ